MALSGSYNYTESITAAQIIALALRRLGVLGIAETINSTEEANALIVLNLLIKEWSAQGADVWLRKKAYLFLENPGEVNEYSVGTSGTASITSSYAMTTLASSATASASTVTVTDDTNISNADNILIMQADGTFHVTTVNGAPSANVVTLTASTASDTTASSGALVYTWAPALSITSKITHLVYAARKENSITGASTNSTLKPGHEIPIEIVGEQDYRDRSTQTLQTGAPTMIFHRQGTIRSSLKIWPTGGGGYDKLTLQYVPLIQDLDATTDNIDISAEGINSLAHGLAAEMCPEYGITGNERKEHIAIAEAKKNDYFNSMSEDASVIFGKDERRT